MTHETLKLYVTVAARESKPQQRSRMMVGEDMLKFGICLWCDQRPDSRHKKGVLLSTIETVSIRIIK